MDSRRSSGRPDLQSGRDRDLLLGLEAEPWKTDDINYCSHKKWCLVSTVAMDHGLGNGDMGKGFKMNRPKGNFRKK